MEKMLIRGVAKDNDVVRVSVLRLPDQPGIAFKLFSKLAAKNVNVDIILQSAGRDGTKDITFTVPLSAEDQAREAALAAFPDLTDDDFIVDAGVSKISIVGAGMETHPGTASQMFEALYDADINIQMISTSEIKISVLVDEKDADKAVSAIHESFFPED